MRSIADVSGLVLAGGMSQRMGSDKGLLNVHGETLREYIYSQLRQVCNNTYVSCRPEQQVPLSMNPIHDESFTSGPLNGLLSAFHHNASCAWLAVAVDMPYVDCGIFQALIANRDPSCTATCFINDETGMPEPLLTIFEPMAFPMLMEFAAKGNSGLRHFLSQHRVKLISSIPGKFFRSLNDPDDVMELTEVCDGRLKLRGW